MNELLVARKLAFSACKNVSNILQMYTRGSLGLSRYNATPDYAAATRRSALVRKSASLKELITSKEELLIILPNKNAKNFAYLH